MTNDYLNTAIVLNLSDWADTGGCETSSLRAASVIPCLCCRDDITQST
jgi:hypothetical protein